MKGTPANEKLFWNNRARNYPLPFEPETLAKTERILSMLRRLGARFENRVILDIGCGTGVFGLPLASGAKQILGLDSSPAMLKIFRAERRKRGIKNADCILSSWSAIRTKPISGRFDIALASMTMAIKTEADLLKMEKAALERCVYVGWAGVRRNALLKKIYAAHGVEYRAPEGAAIVIEILKRLGREPVVRFITDRIRKKASVRETMRDVEIGLKVNGTKINKAWVETLLKKKARKGVVSQTTLMRKAVITWLPKAARTEPHPR